VIKNFRHKGLGALYHTGDVAGVQPDQAKRLRRILAVIDNASTADDFQGLPGLRLHPLKGRYRGYWSLTVSGNWRVVFRFDGEDAADVTLIDYH
jgi:proteic killer suppression protein